MPAVISTMQPTLATVVPSAAGWVHELKHDGWRIVARIAAGAVRLTTRTGRDYTRSMAPIAAALATLGVSQAIVDGEVAAPDHTGACEACGPACEARLTYYAFDLLWLNDMDLRKLPLLERKFRLALLLRDQHEKLIYSAHVEAEQGQALYDKAIAAGGEGIVSKRGDSRYRAGDTTAWVEIKPAEVRERPAASICGGFERAARRRGVKAR
jgi:bifunctional non-homologous end joining protein LigD